MQRYRPLKQSRHSAVLLLMSVLATFALGLSCGQDITGTNLPGEEINCEWFDKVDNCWRKSLSSFSSLLPDDSSTGVLSSDGKSCTYQDGIEIIFTNPIDTTKLSDPDALRGFAWDFEIRKGGDAIASYREPDLYTIILETSLGEFKLESISSSVVINCPSGDQFNVPMAGLLATCPKENLPAKKTTWDTQGITFSLSGTGGSDVLLFNCVLQ